MLNEKEMIEAGFFLVLAENGSIKSMGGGRGLFLGVGEIKRLP